MPEEKKLWSNAEGCRERFFAFSEGRRDRMRTYADFVAQAARLVLEACWDIEKCLGHSVGLLKLIGFLVGEDSSFMRYNGLAELTHYGCFRFLKRMWVKKLVQALRESGYLKLEGSFRPVLRLSEEGAELVESPHELPLLPQWVAQDQILGLSFVSTPLELKLRELRARLGRKLGRTPRHLVSDAVLTKLAKAPPSDLEQVRVALPEELREHSALFWDILKEGRKRAQEV